MANKPVTDQIVKGLAAFLKTNIPSLKAVYDDFPNPSQTLDYPCASIFTAAPTLMNLAPYVVSKDEFPDVNGKFPFRKAVGIYEFRLQLDLWCADKFSRHTLWDLVSKAFNKNPSVAGISLQLPDYFGEWARYIITGFQFDDSELGSERSEWRVKVNIVADVKSVVEYSDYLIETIENNLETPDQIAAGDEVTLTQII